MDENTKNLGCGVIIRILLTTVLVLFVFFGISLVLMLLLNSTGFYGPDKYKEQTYYKTVDIASVMNEYHMNPFNASDKYQDTFIGAYGFVGGTYKDFLGTVRVSIYSDLNKTESPFVCSLVDNKQAEGLKVNDYVYIKGEVGYNSNRNVNYEDLIISYCFLDTKIRR